MAKKTVTLKCSNCEGTFDQDAKWLPPVACPHCGADRVTFEDVTEEGGAEEAEPKPHKHSYRQDGTCACGKVRPRR